MGGSHSRRKVKIPRSFSGLHDGPRGGQHAGAVQGGDGPHVISSRHNSGTQGAPGDVSNGFVKILTK